jgi:hydrogenase maturation protease
VGLEVIRRLRRRLVDRADVEFGELGRGGLELMERLVGYRRAILVDAIRTGAPPGTIHRLTADDIPTLHASSSHDANLKTALALGERMGYTLPRPEEIAVIGIEAQEVELLSEDLTPEVAAVVDAAVEECLALCTTCDSDSA